MNRHIIDISEISESKEIYGHRPNPFIAVFIYCIVGMFIVALIYCSVGKIEVVARANGIIRPNDDISSVSSISGGKIENVLYKDGQSVNKGDPLLELDCDELKITLKGYEDTATDYKDKIAMLKRFIKGIEDGRNPFSAKKNSVDYAYYAQFQDYEMLLEDSSNTIQYDKDKNATNIETVSKQINTLQQEINGLNSYKKSIQSGTDMAEAYPEYEAMYNLYKSEIDSLEKDYESQKLQIESNDTKEAYETQLSEIEGQIIEYGYLVDSIQKGVSVFPVEDNSTCSLLYADYLLKLDEYENAYTLADKEYQEKVTAGMEIPDSVTQDELDSLKIRTENAQKELETYQKSALLQHQQTLEGYKSSALEIQTAIAGLTDKAIALEMLQDSYEVSVSQKYYQTLSSIESSIQSVEIELSSAESNLKLYQLAEKLYSNNTGERNVPISISMASLEKISALLDEKETLEEQLEDIEQQIEQINQQIVQGTVIAESTGVVNVVRTVVAGDIIPAGTTVATIIPKEETAYKMQMYVGNADIASIEVGDEVKYNLNALPSNQYGTIEGIITKVSSDTIVQDGEYSGYYLVEGTIEKLTLEDKDGNTGVVSIGMQAEAKIVTQKKTILRYLLEKINLF